MRELEDVLKEIGDKRADLKQIEEQRLAALNSPGNPAMKDDLDKIYQKHIATARGQVDSLVAELVRWPPHKIEHFAKLKQFWAMNPYDKAVFIMTKYPDNKTALDQELQNVIDIVRQEVLACGFTPLLASDKKYHPELFKNVELYMLGCSKAIALVESKHTHELNPNVTMEWGWLRGTDREVLFLVEKDFDMARADIGGLIQDPFDWANPQPGIHKAVKGFLLP